MPAPKLKLHARSKKSSQHSKNPHSSVQSPGTVLTLEQEEQFHVELYWCIKQLQIGLSLGKLTEKQVLDHKKSLNILRNNETPYMKKRQIMRSSFGDYRSKMLEQEKKIKKILLKVTADAKPSDKSVFIKKASISEENANLEPVGNDSSLTNSTIMKKINFKSENTFRFNFQSTEIEERS